MSEIPIQKPGVDNPKIVDLIRVDQQTGEVVLLMVEPRPWTTQAHLLRAHLTQLQNKVDSYLSYVLDGFFVQQYPQYKGKPVCIELECLENPEGPFDEFMKAAAEFSATENINFRFKVVPPQQIQEYFNAYKKAIS